MIRIYPAIDLIDGKVVRLEQGDYGKKTEYSSDVTGVAKQFEAAGAEYIHIVDLDGAKAGRPVNLEAVRAISRAVSIPIQVGGGVRSKEAAEQLLKYANRIIIGTVAVTKPQALKELMDKFGPKKVVVSIDYKDNMPAVNGWLKSVPLETEKLQNSLLKAGVETVIITDVAKDGLMAGPNVEVMKQWKKANFKIICAGGVSSVQDIKNLMSASIDGAIIGKALYEGKISLKQALETAK